jgi:hypothetical protein
MFALRVAVAFSIFSTTLLAQARTVERIDCSAAPAAVRTAALKQKTRPGTEASCEKIAENGAILFEFKVTTEAGRMRETVYAPDGKLVEFEDESDLSQIPPAARAAIEKATASAELLKVDVIHRGSTVLYEGEYRLAGAKKKVIVDTRGRIVTK